jgi:hypothetical protein
VLCGGLLIGRLGGEVMQLRWSQLTPEEQQGLLSRERWQRSLSELSVSVGSLVGRLTMIGAALGSSLAGLSAALQRGRGRPGSAGSSKRWVRPEPEAPGVTETVTVRSFAEIEALISTAAEAAATTTAAPEPTERPAQHSEAG